MDRTRTSRRFFYNDQIEMMNWRIVKGRHGLTLIELLIALVLSSILIAALYQIFIRQHKTYSVQDQVAEIQQHIRVAVDQMTREIRMAGYGGNLLAIFGAINGFNHIITPANNSITILLADQVGVLKQNAPKETNQLKVTNASSFNTDKKKYLCLNGQNNYLIQNIVSDTLTLTTSLTEDHLANEPVYIVKAITYSLGMSGGKPVLRRNENTGGGAQPVAENIEGLQFTYYDANGNVTSNPSEIRLVKLVVTSKTNLIDPDYKGEGGYRRRTLFTNIQVRNMGL
ncbi:MAG: prepilin-type N-terminal cleavage/methylation domain-containing protein [Syntrophaceae bacterium]|nr:prepilin-type N-terminal cleavage/methylation domain-containing protein [Syntrophaceae bacterium]